MTEPYIREKLQLKAHRLDDLFSCEFRDFDYSSNASNAKSSMPFKSNLPVIFCSDVDELKHRIALHRQFNDSDFESIIGINSGGGVLKVCLTVRSPSAIPTRRYDGDADTVVRSKLSDGVASKNLKDTSVKKLFILAVVPTAQETYRNMLILWDLLKFTSLRSLSPFTFCMDLKLAGITLGLMSHASLHPCSWCNSEKDKLHCEGMLRTLGSIRRQYWRFTESEKRTTKAKQVGNYIHAPLFKFADDTLVLDIMPHLNSI